jgi:methylmalonyl-CoA mutase cobalamin-binding subunit
MGVREVFRPNSTVEEIAHFIRDEVQKR